MERHTTWLSWDVAEYGGALKLLMDLSRFSKERVINTIYVRVP
jgi:hypothetical protein